jgi:hypothetical protein
MYYCLYEAIHVLVSVRSYTCISVCTKLYMYFCLYEAIHVFLSVRGYTCIFVCTRLYMYYCHVENHRPSLSLYLGEFEKSVQFPVES